MGWMNLEPVIQSEVSQKKKNKYCILIHIYIYMESIKVVMMNLFSEKEWRHKHREQLVDTMEEGEGRTD